MRSYTDNWGDARRDHPRCRGPDPRRFARAAASLAWASFPCQDLSEAGAGAGLNGYRSNALWPCLELIDALCANGRPLPMIVLENVVGLMSPRSAGFLDAICDKLTGMGYRLRRVGDRRRAVRPSEPRARVHRRCGRGAAGPRRRLSSPSPVKPFHTPPLVAAHASSEGRADLVVFAGSPRAQYGVRRSDRGQPYRRPLARQGRDGAADRDDGAGPPRQGRGRQARVDRQRPEDGGRPLQADAPRRGGRGRGRAEGPARRGPL